MGIATLSQTNSIMENFGGETVYADTTVLVPRVFTISDSDSISYISFREGKIAFYVENDRNKNRPGVNVTIRKANGNIEGPFNPNTLTTFRNYVPQGSVLEAGDKIIFNFLEDFPKVWEGSFTHTKGVVLLEVQNDGTLAMGTGTGTAQVTYNVNTITPDDPTANPDFTVLIPTAYQLSDQQKVSSGALALKDAKDLTKNYAGDKAVKVTVASAKHFQFDNGGTYKLVDGNKADIPAEITLNKTNASSVVNALLTKEGTKTASTDVLTFNYTVAP